MEEQILAKALTELKKYYKTTPDVAVVLGSGLGNWAETLTDSVTVPYAKIPGLAVSTVLGHAGQFVYGVKNGKKVLCLKGRVHYYEGNTAAECVRPVRLAAMLGAKSLILTNAAGGIRAAFRPGDLMMIADHISLVPSPLIGENIETLGTRFPDMSEIYDAKLIAKLTHLSEFPLRKGVYLQTSGPQYETPAEINLYRLLGADAVGMSTAIEAIAARHAGLKVAGISCITNMASGISKTPLSHSEVKDTAERVKGEFAKLLDTAVAIINED